MSARPPGGARSCGRRLRPACAGGLGREIRKILARPRSFERGRSVLSIGVPSFRPRPERKLLGRAAAGGMIDPAAGASGVPRHLSPGERLAMDLSNKPLTRVLCAEPLEGRWLLSGSANSSEVAAAPAPGVTIEEEFEQDEEEEEGETEILESDLPAPVLAAFQAAFSSATISTVEREEEDGEVEYGITATKDNGRTIDVTLTPDGEILETETFFKDPATELPQSVSDKVREVLGEGT